MELEHVKELQNLYQLQMALKKNDTAEIKKYRKITGVKDDYATLCAKMRFAEIGLAATYQQSLEIYQQERQIIDKIEKLKKEIADIRQAYFFKGEMERKSLKNQQAAMRENLDAANKRVEKAEKEYKETRKQYEKAKKGR